jgi:hypothetical protein
MVVSADYYNAFIAWAFNLFHSVFSGSAVYLHIILNLKRRKMKKILFIISVAILLLLSVSLYNAKPEVIISRLIKNAQINAGQLRYRVYFLKIFPMGEAVLFPEKTEEYRGQKVYHLSATANNSRIFSNFVNAYAILDSYIDIQQLTPILFKQKLVVTGRKDTYREVFYDQANHVMSIAGVRRKIYPNTQDPLSALFNIRHMDFDRVDNLEMGINTNQKNYILRVSSKNKIISIDKKIYKIILLRGNVSRYDKSHYHKSNINMVLLKGKDKLPLSIDVFTRGILINARLIGIE